MTEVARTTDRPRRWGSIADAAFEYAVSKRTVHRWIAGGLVTAYRCGGTVRVDLNEIEQAFLTSAEEAPA